MGTNEELSSRDDKINQISMLMMCCATSLETDVSSNLGSFKYAEEAGRIADELLNQKR